MEIQWSRNTSNSEDHQSARRGYLHPILNAVKLFIFFLCVVKKLEMQLSKLHCNRGKKNHQRHYCLQRLTDFGCCSHSHFCSSTHRRRSRVSMIRRKLPNCRSRPLASSFQFWLLSSLRSTWPQWTFRTKK